MRKKLADNRKFKVARNEAARMIFRYIRIKVSGQIKAVSGIIIYLLLFQAVVLGIPILDAAIIALGMVMVILGLTLFMEGLLLGIMPMGEEIGIRLPQKAKVSVILAIAFILGLASTLAEPAIGVLKSAGSSVLAWRAPMLFLFLNKHSSYLVGAVGIGVGIALVLGMFRFLKGWSLKPYIYTLISVLLVLSAYASFHPNLVHIIGLAWDCGGVTTGPVTVPLVLALGIGISHVANKGGENTEGGFGVVTLASLVPVIAVLLLGVVMASHVPKPMDDVSFFAASNTDSRYLFENDAQMKDYAISRASYKAQLAAFDNNPDKLMEYVAEIGRDDQRIKAVFNGKEKFRTWLIHHGSTDLKHTFAQVLLLDEQSLKQDSTYMESMNIGDYIRRNTVNALRAIVPLSLFMLGVLYFILRERLTKADEIFLGLAFAVIGMAVFGGGIELGLSKIGDQVGSNLPVSFTPMENPADQLIIRDFDKGIVNTAVKPDGSQSSFFYYEENGDIKAVTFEEKNYDNTQNLYSYTPVRGPLFGDKPYSMAGIAVVLLFAFIMGYSATLAEPALNALGLTVEDITVGAFKKTLLIQAVAVGVGVGIMLGVAKIIWNIPLFWMLGPMYVLLLIVTRLSSEEYVNIGWDSAGVTTGPITVPLVLSMGLGIGTQVGVVEGFGILSLASVCPILSVLGMGLVVSYRRKAFLRDYEPEIVELSTGEIAS
ncbi:MAG: DUF1538 domain-containing protein [Candidatus Cloacimonetes bacterium]|jgi:hypothetical protein|nr:DUF1538 domain-containing protein [Candidatus Cloacimonadota bacterium]MDD2506677.1 DUF1538 domain-containing protein [Candidatus Cloacimonadota bacterium]MDD4559959.1 DUF1538 domain-containing protein [Candidatus Cloacimonadota bacterium]